MPKILRALPAVEKNLGLIITISIAIGIIVGAAAYFMGMR